jgi:hypothetical protein
MHSARKNTRNLLSDSARIDALIAAHLRTHARETDRCWAKDDHGHGSEIHQRRDQKRIRREVTHIDLNSFLSETAF